MTTRTKTLCLGTVALGLLHGCEMTSTLPDNELRLEESTLEIRGLQSRTFSAPSEKAILAATIAVLQDMEYNVDRIESPLGVVTASKVADADSTNEQVGLFFADLLCALAGGDCGAMETASDEQLIMLTLVVQPSLANVDQYVARVTLQRVVYDTLDRVKLKEEIHEPEMYQQIFERLSKSIFLQVET